MYVRKCKTWKCVSLQNKLYNILQYEIYFPFPLDKTAQRSVQRVAQ